MHTVKAIAMYFPQFHTIPENDEWWGKGFTDWENVKSGYSIYDGHRQPRVPLGNNYYDLTNKDVLLWQSQLAKQYGIFGFSIYHYWFDGKQLLQKPKELFLNNPDIDINFCLTWANETWARRWEGDDRKILQLQTHEPTKEKWKQHFDYLLPYFLDKRAIRIDGKVLFQIYRPYLIDRVDQMLCYWRKLARECGLGELYFMAINTFNYHQREVLDAFDGVLLFQPHVATNTLQIKGLSFLIESMLRHFPEPWVESFRALRKMLKSTYTKYDYEKVCSVAIRQKELYPTRDVYNMAFLEWDNTARYKDKATIYQGCTPNVFRSVFRQMVKSTLENDKDKRFVFINAWNEWAEGTYLEPDTLYKYQYLEVLRQELSVE